MAKIKCLVTGVPTQAAGQGTFALDKASGVVYVNKDGAVKWEALSFGIPRIVASGSTVVGAGASVNSPTFAALADERVFFAIAVPAKAADYQVIEALGPASGNQLRYALIRETTGTDYHLDFDNGTTAITVEWIIFGLQP